MVGRGRLRTQCSVCGSVKDKEAEEKGEEEQRRRKARRIALPKVESCGRWMERKYLNLVGKVR